MGMNHILRPLIRQPSGWILIFLPLNRIAKVEANVHTARQIVIVKSLVVDLGWTRAICKARRVPLTSTFRVCLIVSVICSVTSRDYDHPVTTHTWGCSRLRRRCRNGRWCRRRDYNLRLPYRTRRCGVEVSETHPADQTEVVDRRH